MQISPERVSPAASTLVAMGIPSYTYRKQREIGTCVYVQMGLRLTGSEGLVTDGQRLLRAARIVRFCTIKRFVMNDCGELTLMERTLIE